MNAQTSDRLKALILIFTAIFFAEKIASGKLYLYINQRFAWLTWLATILLALIAFAYQRTGYDEDRAEHGQNGRGHLDGHENAWVALALVALPLVLGILFRHGRWEHRLSVYVRSIRMEWAWETTRQH